MEFLSKQLHAYVQQNTSQEPDLLQQLSRETHIKTMLPQMLSGHVQGRFLSLLAKIMRPTHILEIGTFTGYSALCMAEGLAANGMIHTIDINHELEDIQNKYFEASEYRNNIQQYVGNALEIIPTLDTIFDMVFIDADKRNYSNYLDLVLPKLRVGGIVLADNVLWSGKILEEDQDKDTAGLVEFAQKVQTHEKLENVLISMRDGILMAMKIE